MKAFPFFEIELIKIPLVDRNVYCLGFQKLQKKCLIPPPYYVSVYTRLANVYTVACVASETIQITPPPLPPPQHHHQFSGERNK